MLQWLRFAKAFTVMKLAYEGLSINECRRHIEEGGGRVRYYKAWPLIGRGGVRHDQVSHEDIERMLDRALNPSVWHRLSNFMRGIPWR